MRLEKTAETMNARLIASAPNLIDALQWIVDCGDGCPTAEDMVRAMRTKARAAIAKATKGE